MKVVKIFFFSFLCLLYSLFFCLPELLRKENEFYKSVETFENAKIVEIKMLMRADKHYLLIKTKEGNEYEVGKTYKKYFQRLSKESNKGKKITFYTRNATNKYPSKIEIGDEIIYDLTTGLFWSYLIVLATPILIYLSITEYRSFKKLKK